MFDQITIATESSAAPQTPPRQFTLGQLLRWFAWISVILAVLYYLGHAIQLASSAAQQSSCSNNLKQIGIGLQNYYDTYGKYPPAITYDKDGKPAHSWRVLITTFLMKDPFITQYRYDEPWDGPSNRLLHGSPLAMLYSCPGEANYRKNDTSYLAVIGPGTAWPDDGRSADFSTEQGREPVLIIVEVRDSSIHWMEPRDLHIDDITNGVNAGKGLGIGSVHPTGAMGVFADGSVQLLPNHLSADDLRRLLTVGGDPETSVEDEDASEKRR